MNLSAPSPPSLSPGGGEGARLVAPKQRGGGRAGEGAFRFMGHTATRAIYPVMKSFLTFSLATITVCATASAAENLNVFPENKGIDPPNQLVSNILKQQCQDAYDRRRETYEMVKTVEDCLAYQKRMREFFTQQIGGFPERTPLNARVVGHLKGDGFRVEKVIFESQPNHHVTALVYLPETRPPYPGVLVPCGHSHNGKAAGHYQRICMLLAKNGIAAMCYDPVGQGERYQVLADTPQKHFRGYPRYQPPHPRVQLLCTTEHTLMNVSTSLLGGNTARYRIWDGMRGIDYLVSRPDIDAKRIGCTGISGGGTLTSYIMALDDRVVCAAPGCYLTSFKHLLDSSGPQDGEQTIFGQLGYGMDEAEYVIMRAPRPTLILAGTQDRTFDVVGTWDVFRDAKRFYSRMGFSERVEIAEPDVPHGFPMELRVASTRWMRRWLLNIDDAITEPPDMPVYTNEEVQCSPQGQVMLMPGERSVFDLNAQWQQRLAVQRVQFQATAGDIDIRHKVRELAVVPTLKQLPRLTSSSFPRTGPITRLGYRIERLVYQTKGGFPLPALRFVPDKVVGEPVLYLHGEGKHEDASTGGPIEKLVQQGTIVVAVDLSGIGETERNDNRRISWTVGMFGPDYHEVATAYLLGKPVVGRRAAEVLMLVKSILIESKNPISPGVRVVAIGEAAIPCLHAAALEPQLFASLELHRMIPSWVEVVKSPETTNQFVNSVHGALRYYDLPDLLKLCEGVKVSVIEPVDVLGQRVK
mgnify:CR=1 FL=1